MDFEPTEMLAKPLMAGPQSRNDCNQFTRVGEILW